MESDLEKINQNLEKVVRGLKQQNSMVLTFARGIVVGLGTAIGASIVAGLLISLLNITVDTLDDIPFLDSIIESVRSQQNTD
jgi:uncharacterized protein (DUF697 family)